MMTADEMRMIRTLIDQETNRIADQVEALSTLLPMASAAPDTRYIFHELAQAIRKKP